MKISKLRQQKGFSLLEVLIAFSILALSIGMVLRIFSGGIKTASVAEEFTVAVQIAESTMAKVGSEIPLKSHQDSGIVDDKYHWQIAISPYSLNSVNFDVKTVGAELYKVKVTVDWGEENSNSRQIDLATLKLHIKANDQLQ